MDHTEPVTRTLPDGYLVTHHPPDEKHPGGKMVLQPGQSRLRARLLDAHPGHMMSQAAKAVRKQNLVDWRRERLRRGGVPPEKRPV